MVGKVSVNHLGCQLKEGSQRVQSLDTEAAVQQQNQGTNNPAVFLMEFVKLMNGLA